MICLHCQKEHPPRELSITFCRQDVCFGCLNFHVGQCGACRGVLNKKKERKK